MTNLKTNPFRDGDHVVFIQDDRDGTTQMPKGTKGVITDHQADDSYGVIYVTLKGSGKKVAAWVNRLTLEEAADPPPHEGFTEGAQVEFINDDSWDGFKAEVGTRAIYLGRRFNDDEAAKLELPNGRTHVAWLRNIRPVVTTEQVTIRETKELRVGDVVVREYDLVSHYAAVEREKAPEVPAPKPGTFGTAVVDGQRYKGFVSAMGRFYYPGARGIQEAASKGRFTDFRPEGS